MVPRALCFHTITDCIRRPSLVTLATEHLASPLPLPLALSFSLSPSPSRLAATQVKTLVANGEVEDTARGKR